ncbi:MAG: prephenate dehydrogenase [Parashewanella sp.]
MPHNKVIEQLQQNIQLAYRQAIDADTRLDALQQSGHGKFTAIFAKEQGFSTDSNRFKPYIQELVEGLEDIKQNFVENNVETLVKKLAAVLQTLQAFKQEVK